jgi:hypothetical protein
MDRIDYLIDNAYKAQQAAQDPWFKNYWSIVALTLLRKYRKCH